MHWLYAKKFLGQIFAELVDDMLSASIDMYMAGWAERVFFMSIWRSRKVSQENTMDVPLFSCSTTGSKILALPFSILDANIIRELQTASSLGQGLSWLLFGEHLAQWGSTLVVACRSYCCIHVKE